MVTKLEMTGSEFTLCPVLLAFKSNNPDFPCYSGWGCNVVSCTEEQACEESNCQQGYARLAPNNATGQHLSTAPSFVEANKFL